MLTRQKLRIVLFLFLFMFFGQYVPHAQVLNIDRELGSDTIPKKYRGVLDFSFSSDKQKRNITEFTQQSELDVLLKKNKIFIALSHTDIVFNGATVLENNGYFQIRLRDNDSLRVSPDYFVQYQWNGVLGLQNRALAGVNSRFRFWDDKTDDLYTSLGVFYEFENWNPNLANYAFESTGLNPVSRQIIRANFSIKTAFKITRLIDFSAISYLQFPLNAGAINVLNPRWYLDSQLHFVIKEHLDFNIKYNHNLDYFRPLPIDPFFYSLTLGIRIHY